MFKLTELITNFAFMAYLDKTGTGQDISVESVIITIGYIIDATLHIVARPELHFE